MKKLLYFSIAVVMLGIAAPAFADCINNVDTATGRTCITVNAASGSGTSGSNLNTVGLTYIPLEPLPGGEVVQGGTASFASLLKAAFSLLLRLCTLLMIVLIVIAGATYMFSSTPIKLQGAKDRAWAAFKGLAILGFIWLIAYTINPQLLDFNLLSRDTPNSTIIGAAPPATPASAQPSLTPLQAQQIIAELPKDKPTCAGMRDIVNAHDTSAIQGVYDVLKALRSYTYSLYGENIGSQDQTIQDERKFVQDCTAAGN